MSTRRRSSITALSSPALVKCECGALMIERDAYPCRCGAMLRCPCGALMIAGIDHTCRLSPKDGSRHDW